MSSILSRCRVNDVIGVKYGDKPEERVCRVVDVRNMRSHPVAHKSRLRRPDVPRGSHLVTCQSTDGQIRSFYAGVEKSARKIPALRAAILYIRGRLPARRKATV